MSALLPYLIPALFLLVIGIFFVGGILSVGALSQWLDRRRQTFFSLMLWMIAVGIAIPSLTKPRSLVEMDLLSMPVYLGGGGKVAMAGFWATKILAWLIVLLAAALLTSRVLQARSSYTSAKQGNAPVFLFLAVAVFLITGGLVNSLFGTKPDLGHDLIYPFLLFGVALTLPGEGYVNTARTVRNLIVVLCAASLLMALISPDQVLQTGHKGLIPGFNIRLWGTMPHANALGGLALFYLIVERLVPWKNSTLRWLAWGLVFVTLILTQSKTNWLIGLALAGILFALEMRRALGEGVKNPLRQQAVAAVLSILIVGTVAAYAGLLVIGPETLVNRIGQVFVSTGGATLTGRDVIWALAIKEWQANPLFGYGPTIWDDEYRRAVGLSFAYHGHNQYLNTLSQAGLIGLAGLVLMLMAYAYYAMRYFTATRGVLLAVLAMILIRGLTETPMSVLRVLSQETLINLTLVALVAQLVRSEVPAGLLHSERRGTT